jgi:hypothetical protein
MYNDLIDNIILELNTIKKYNNDNNNSSFQLENLLESFYNDLTNNSENYDEKSNKIINLFLPIMTYAYWCSDESIN